MELKAYLQTLYEYNYWANHRYLKAAQGLSPEQFTRRQGHSWDSVQGVLVHMMSSEIMWPARWRGGSPGFLDPADFPTCASIIDRWAEVEKDMREFLGQQSEDSLQKKLSYTNTKGETFTLPLWQMMAHVPNHNTHHRGELAAMFALMSASHPEEEVVQFFLVASGQRKD